MENSRFVSGFTIVRNALRLRYPFRECVVSALPLCDELIISCGDSSDGTEELCEELKSQFPEKIRILHSEWNTRAQRGGEQLRLNTDMALSACQGDWCLYLQADEVIHEADYDTIRESIAQASTRPEVDGLVFDYLHFYGSYDYIVRGRNWYRREVRLFKNHRNISAYRDAQGFRRDNKRLKAFRSGARIFHYGYVRDPASMRKKSEEMSKWWGVKPVTDDKDLKPTRHVGIQKFQASHPMVMMRKIRKENIHFDPSQHQRKWDWSEIKNAFTLIGEVIFRGRIAEFRNFDLVKN